MTAGFAGREKWVRIPCLALYAEDVGMVGAKEIAAAACAGHMEALRGMGLTAPDLNVADGFGDTLLEEIVSELCIERVPQRYEVVQFLLSCGADPNRVGAERTNALTSAMLAMDTPMLQLLLEAGADPNIVSGFTEDELLYDWAESDYVYRVYDFALPEAGPEGAVSEDEWLLFLDQMAIRHNARRPDHLVLLRKHGARTMRELRSAP